MSQIQLLLGVILAAALSVVAGADELILCGGDEVFILEVPAPNNGPPVKIWSWQARNCGELPAYLKDSFRTTDDCKPIDGGRAVLITSSGGAVALVERKPLPHLGSRSR